MNKPSQLRLVLAAALIASMFGATATSVAQTSPTTAPDTSTPAAPAAPPAAAPAPLPMPSMAGPLATAVPHEISVGSETSGKLEVTGILSGMAWSEGKPIPGDPASHWDVSNAQIFIQKTTGRGPIYPQSGPYNPP